MLFSTANILTKSILSFLLLLNIVDLYAKDDFKVLGWANVFDISDSIKSKVKAIESSCNIKISYDTYSNTNDFITQISEHDYEYNIILVPNTYLNFVTKHMHKEHNKKLDSIISSYNPDIRKHFKSLSYKSNITYFAHSITGVLINKDKIKFNKISNIQDLVNSMNGNDMLIVLDDPIELSSLIESNTSKRKNGNKNPSDVINNIRKFKSMVVDKDITIVNFYNKRMDENGFASAISWSGEAIRDISIVKSNGKNNLVFVTPKDMSIISSDILVQLVRDKKTDCAMQLLSSQDFVDEVNYQMYYFSPFISYKSLKSLDSTYHDIREQFLVYLPNAKWLDSVDKDGFERVLYEWDKLKFNAIKNKAKIQDKNISQ